MPDNTDMQPIFFALYKPLNREILSWIATKSGNKKQLKQEFIGLGNKINLYLVDLIDHGLLLPAQNCEYAINTATIQESLKWLAKVFPQTTQATAAELSDGQLLRLELEILNHPEAIGLYYAISSQVVADEDGVTHIANPSRAGLNWALNALEAVGAIQISQEKLHHDKRVCKPTGKGLPRLTNFLNTLLTKEKGQ